MLVSRKVKNKMSGEDGNGQRIKDHDLLIRIDERVTEIHKTVQSSHSRFEKVECRLDNLDGWRKYVQGSIAVMGVVSTFLSAKIMRFL